MSIVEKEAVRVRQIEPMDVVEPIAELLADRVGEEMALNDRYLNPQMGRIL